MITADDRAASHRPHGINVAGRTALILVLGLPLMAGASGCKSRAKASPSADSAPHTVRLNWNPSASVVAGYNIYRGTYSGGPYTKLNSSPVATTAYTDSTVQSGQTYYYVVKAVDSKKVESVASNEITAKIPTP